MIIHLLALKFNVGYFCIVSNRCTSNEAYDSRWGCATKKYPLNIIVTDEANHVIFPLPEFIKQSAGMWYYMPLVDEV